MGKYSDELLEGLTDEEREALEEAAREDEAETNGQNNNDEGDDNADGDENGTQDAEGQAGEAGQGNNDDAEAKGKDAGKADDGDGGADAGDGTDKAGDDKSADNAADQIAPLLVAEVPADAEAKLKEISDQKAALVEKFDDGDITGKEYQTQLDALNKEERAVERAVEKAQLAAEMRKQQEVNTWLNQVKDFTSRAQPEYSTSRVRWMALDAFVKEIGSKPENANLSGQEILQLAHQKVVEDLGAAQAKTADKADDKASRPLKGSKAEPPKTLAKVPAADNNELENSRWAALDRLREQDPEAHEERMMKMSDAERDEYLARE